MSHFEDRDPLEHVVQKRVEGILSISESHGSEMPGHLSAGADALRETGIILLLFWLFLSLINAPFILSAIAAFGVALVAWKTGRSAWLGWSRLERLHRLIEQEKYEIEHHRPQEREELNALYRAKGFEGKLLDEVVDVLMADQDRLLKVMLEEELGLTLMAYEHPIKQSLGAFVGSLAALIVAWVLSFSLPDYGMAIASFLLITTGAAISAFYERNKVISAIVWNASLGALAVGIAYFLFKLLMKI